MSKHSDFFCAILIDDLNKDHLECEYCFKLFLLGLIFILKRRLVNKYLKGSSTYQLTPDRGGLENFVSIASARGGVWQKCQLTKCKEKEDKMRKKKQALKVNKLRIFMKKVMYLKNDFVSKKAFSRENSQMGLRQFLSSRVRKILSRGGKNSCVRHFFEVC